MNSDIETLDNPVNKSSKPTRFQHLKQASQVAAKHPSTLMIGLVTGLVVIVFMVFMLSTHSKPIVISTSQDAFIPNHNEILKQNEAKLRQWQLGQAKTVAENSTPLFPSSSSASKSIQARLNAPTQLYSAMGSEGGGQHVTMPSTSNPSNPTLVGQGAFAQFANSQNNHVATVTAVRLAHPQYTIAQGEFIQAVLETAITSDLPGMVRAVVTQPVYAYEGERVLIPAGSRLVGQYTSMASNGAATTRVFVIWNRILTPDGLSMILNSPGTDALGTAGMGADAVDTHFWQQFGTASLLSVMSATNATAGVSSYTQPNSANMYQQSLASGFQQAAQNSLGQNLIIQPTLHIHQGDAVTVFVANDVDLYAVLGEPQTNNCDEGDGHSDWELLSP